MTIFTAKCTKVTVTKIEDWEKSEMIKIKTLTSFPVTWVISSPCPRFHMSNNPNNTKQIPIINLLTVLCPMQHKILRLMLC